jgi:hypothetical protein
MPLDEDHARFERAVEIELEHWLTRYDELRARFSNQDCPEELRRDLVDRITQLAHRTWPPKDVTRKQRT